jgi:hypothetical protein
MSPLDLTSKSERLGQPQAAVALDSEGSAYPGKRTAGIFCDLLRTPSGRAATGSTGACSAPPGLVINRIGAEMMSGLPVRESPPLPSLGSDRRTVIVTLGAGGLVVAEPGAAPWQIAALPLTAVSTRGAGDRFVGALAFRLARGDGMVAACRFANSMAGRFVAGKPEGRGLADRV